MSYAEAMAAIVKAVSPFGREGRIRILTAALILLGEDGLSDVFLGELEAYIPEPTKGRK